MLGVRRDADHGILAQPRAQAIDQRHLDGRGRVLRQQPEVAAGQRHRPFARQHDRLHRRRQRHAGETFAQHAGEMRRRARRRTERKRHRGWRQAALPQVTLVREVQLQASDAQSPGGEPSREFLHEAVDAEAERFRVAHGRGQVELGFESRWRHEWRARIGDAAENAIDDAHQFVAAAARQPVARQRRGLPERRDAGIRERCAQRVVEIDQRQRQRREQPGQLRDGRDGLRAAGAGEEQRGAGCWRQSEPRGVPQIVGAALAAVPRAAAGR